MSAPQPPADACGEVTTGLGDRPLGPCVKTGKHAVHADGRGCTWWMAQAEAVPDTGQARADRLADGIRRFADDCKLLLDSGGLDNRVTRSIAQQERNLRALLAADSAPEPPREPVQIRPAYEADGSVYDEPPADTVQAPAVAALWLHELASGTGLHVQLRRHWPELAKALDALVDGAA